MNLMVQELAYLVIYFMINIDARQGLDLSNYNGGVYVIDNLFPAWFSEYVHLHTICAPTWLFGRTSGENTGEIPAFVQHIFPPKSANADNNCFEMMCHALLRTLPPHELTDIVVNGQQHFHNTEFHTDCPGDDGLTFIYYVNMDYRTEWGGQTEVKVGSTLEVVDFIPGRVALFKGNYQHRGCSFTIPTDSLRATVAIKVNLND